jgi:hypothetical protein
MTLKTSSQLLISQVIVLYDESWEINDMIIKLGTTTTKSFILYFLPLDPLLAMRIHSSKTEENKLYSLYVCHD